MKTKTCVLFLFVFMLFQSAIAQETETILPKIENYTKGELEIKVAPFGLENPIAVGKITADGTVHLNWNSDISSIKDSELYMGSIKGALGMSYCNDETVEQSNEEAKAVDVGNLSLYKYGQQVGALFPATQKEMEENNGMNRSSGMVLGSTLSWFYSDSDVLFKGTCSVNANRNNMYDFKEVKNYTTDFKKGWNMVLYTLIEKEDWKNETAKGSLPKTITKTSITKIPSTINWYLNYWANDELLEIEHQLVMLKPITKEHYESWLPKKLGNLKRTGYEIGKTLERMPSLNNVNMLFEKGSKTIDLTIVDCADNKDAASMYTLMKEMASRDWNDKTKTGYLSAAKMDDKRVMTDYNEEEAKTTVSYNANKRFLIKAEATNVEPKELWKHLKTLNFETLVKE